VAVRRWQAAAAAATHAVVFFLPPATCHLPPAS
jgi:hypothetical protein